ncbi:MAG: phosphopantetheine-binding protein [Alphaproteobacteria bacterium]|nr:phosphopantetheine-binding protein [Alphaproteobacteria bacterium]
MEKLDSLVKNFKNASDDSEKKELLLQIFRQNTLQSMSWISDQRELERIQNLGRETNLKDDLGLDSLDYVELMMLCEKSLGVSIDDSDVIMSMDVVGEIIDRLYVLVEEQA